MAKLPVTDSESASRHKAIYNYGIIIKNKQTNEKELYRQLGSNEPATFSSSGEERDYKYFGAPGRIRTYDHWLRSPLLYPAELPGRVI